MDSLVLELQRAANDEGKSLPALVRMAMTTARKLGLTEMDEWLKHELEGYPDLNSVPQYRFVSGRLIVRTPFRDVPAAAEKEKDRGTENIEIVGSSIAEVQKLADASQQPMIQQGIDKHGPIYLILTNATLHAILDRVRTIILGWSLDLESEGILGEGMTFTSEEKDSAHAASSIVNVFPGDVGQAILQQSSSGSQNVTMISASTPSDLAKLVREHLDELELGGTDKQELEAAITEIEAQEALPNPDTGSMRTTLTRMKDLLVAGAAARSLIQAFTDVISNLPM